MSEEDEVRDYVDEVGIRSSKDPDSCLGRRMGIVNAWPNSGVSPPMSLLIRSYPGQDRTSWLLRKCSSTSVYKLFRNAGLFDRDMKGYIPVYAVLSGVKVSKIELLIDEDFPEKGVLLAAMVMLS